MHQGMKYRSEDQQCRKTAWGRLLVEHVLRDLSSSHASLLGSLD